MPRVLVRRACFNPETASSVMDDIETKSRRISERHGTPTEHLDPSYSCPDPPSGSASPHLQGHRPMRIALIHALKHSIPAIEDAFARLWPEARLANLLDDSLSADLARDGALTPAMHLRFLTLARYA